MVSSSFQTENLTDVSIAVDFGRVAGYALLDVLGKSGQQVLAVLVQAVGLFLELVGGVDDGDVETTLFASLGVLQEKNQHPAPKQVQAIGAKRRTLMFGRSETSEASSFWRRAEAEKALAAGATLRWARRSERVADCRRAMVELEGRWDQSNCWSQLVALARQ